MPDPLTVGIALGYLKQGSDLVLGWSKAKNVDFTKELEKLEVLQRGVGFVVKEIGELLSKTSSLDSDAALKSAFQHDLEMHKLCFRIRSIIQSCRLLSNQSHFAQLLDHYLKQIEGLVSGMMPTSIGKDQKNWNETKLLLTLCLSVLNGQYLFLTAISGEKKMPDLTEGKPQETARKRHRIPSPL
jgi:hypothetical protein